MTLKFNSLPLWAFLLLFSALAVLLRFLSFRFSVIDHDESTYLVIAQEILDGKTFYIDVWDTKPVGIFLIFAGIIGAFGHSILMVRLAAALAIGITAFLLYLSARRWNPQNKFAWIAGLAYVLACSVHRWNFAANTEIFFNFFTALGLYFFTGKKNAMNFFLTGLSFGTGFVIKYFVLFDLLALWIFSLALLLRDRRTFAFRTLASNTLSMALGFVVPFTAMMAYFWQAGLFGEFRFATFVMPGRYGEDFIAAEALNYFANFHLVYAPLVILAYAVIIWGRDRQLAWLGSIWLAMVWIILILPGKFFFHYYFQLLVPLCFLMAGASGLAIRSSRIPLAWRRAIVIILSAGFLAWNASLQYRLFIKAPDIPRMAAAYLRQVVTDKDGLYCNKSTVIYFLLDKSPPMKYIHPSLLSNPDHIEALGIDPRKEFTRLAARQPDFMVIEGTPQDPVSAMIDAEYSLEKEFGPGVKIYSRKKGGIAH